MLDNFLRLCYYGNVIKRDYKIKNQVSKAWERIRGKKMERNVKKNLFVLYKDTQKNVCLMGLSSDVKEVKNVASYIADKSIESPCYGTYFNGYTGKNEVIFSRNPYEGFMNFDDAVSLIEKDDNFRVIKKGYVNRDLYMKDYITFEA